MAKNRFGEMPPRYTLAVNPHDDIRCCKCPKCSRATYPRKFALLIHVDGYGPLVLGKTCKYCSKCEFIIVHQDELEDILTERFSDCAPEVIGNDYFIFATVDKKVWKQSLGKEGTVEDIRPHTADIKHYVELGYDPGGWRPAGEE